MPTELCVCNGCLRRAWGVRGACEGCLGCVKGVGCVR